MRVISLTTIPPRFDHIRPTLECLLAQEARIDHILLYIPKTYRRFPDYDGRLPDVPEGIEIRRVDEDFGPASKVLHAVREFRGQDCEILFCDDDRLYPPEWAQSLLDARAAHPDAAIAPVAFEVNNWLVDSKMIRAHQPRAVARDKLTALSYWKELLLWHMGLFKKLGPEPPHFRHIKTGGYRDFFQGYGGVLVRPEFFDDDVFDIPPVYWAVDDIWLSGMLAKAGTPIWVPENLRGGPDCTTAHDSAPLYKAVIDGADRNQADRACCLYFQKEHGIWL